MRTVTYRLVDLQRSPVIAIGFVGENEHTRILFDCLKVFEEYPDSIPSLTVRPPVGDTYPGIVVRDGDMVIWDIMNSDLISEGYGEIQLTFVQDSVVVKTYIARTKILKSLIPVGEIPTPIADWILRANTILGEIPATIEASIDAALEAAKESGEFDGFSPVVSVEEIEGGHRVSIQDATHTDKFDVMNGLNGSGIVPQFTYNSTTKEYECDMTFEEVLAACMAKKCSGCVRTSSSGRVNVWLPLYDFLSSGVSFLNVDSDPTYGTINRTFISYWSDGTIHFAQGQIYYSDIAKRYDELVFPVAKGTLCYNSGYLYKAKQNIQTQEDWTSAHWERANISEELASLFGEIAGKADKEDIPVVATVSETQDIINEYEEVSA